MPLTTIAGNIQIPTGAAPNSARLVFTLASWDIGGAVVYAPDPTVEPLSGTAYSIPLESTTDKERQSAYKVELLWYSTAQRATLTENLSVIAVPPTGGPFSLPDLVAVPIATPVPADILALCQAYASAAANNAALASAHETAAEAALAETVALAADVTDIAAGAALWTEAGAAGGDIVRAADWPEVADLVALGQVSNQVTVTAAGYVVDADDHQNVITSLAAGAEIDARALEVGRAYVFRVYPNTSYSMKIDLGEGAIINGFLTFRGVELRAGQSVRIMKASDTVIYVHSAFAPIYRDHIGTDAYQEPAENGEWKYWRRVSVNAGATASFGLPGQYAGMSQAGNPRLSMFATIGATATQSAVLRALTDATVTVHNPNGSAVNVEYTVEGLRTYITSLGAGGDHFRSLIAPLEPARDLTRDYTVILAGQSLANAYIDRAGYKGLDTALRAGGILTATHYLDLVNTAKGGSLIDKQTVPAYADYWYDSATNADGPLLTAALAKIAAAYTAGKTPQAIIYDHGQTEALYLGTTASRVAVTEAMNAIVNALAAAAPGIPIYLQTLVGRENVAADGSQIMREIQLDVAATNANVDGFIDHYDSKLIDGTHPLNSGYRRAGERMGKLIAADYTPPTIAAAVLAAGKITVTVGAISLSATPVDTVLDFAGVKTASGYIRARGTIKSATSIELIAHPLSGHANLNAATHVAWPLSDYVLEHDGDFPQNAAGLLIKSALFAL